jgi:hypothetical protein
MGRFVSDTDVAAAGIHSAAAADFGDPDASGSTISATKCTQWLKPCPTLFILAVWAVDGGSSETCAVKFYLFIFYSFFWKFVTHFAHQYENSPNSENSISSIN